MIVMYKNIELPTFNMEIAKKQDEITKIKLNGTNVEIYTLLYNFLELVLGETELMQEVGGSLNQCNLLKLSNVYNSITSSYEDVINADQKNKLITEIQQVEGLIKEVKKIKNSFNINDWPNKKTA